MATDRELRAASDGLLESLGQLHDLEMKKREATPGSTDFVALSRAVEAAAREVLAKSARQTDVAVETVAAVETVGEPDISRKPIEAMEPGRDPAAILAEWREAERRLAVASPGSDPFREAANDIDRLRAEYQAAFDAHRADG